jgi:RsiW-degrading membrane proteinase PrsW (M82 family)
MPPGANAQRQESQNRWWKQPIGGKIWWKVLLLGLAAYLDAMLLFAISLNPHIVPLAMLLASALVPVTFVVYCWEKGAFTRMPSSTVGLTFVAGAVLGILVAAPLEAIFVLPIPIVSSFTVGLIEESAKVLAVLTVIWFLQNRRPRGELNGLVLGAAAGMGFAAVETAGYGLAAFMLGFKFSLTHGSALAPALGSGVLWMTFLLVLRMLMAIFGHGTWTAIACAALWRGRGASSRRVTWGVALAFACAVTLHGLWDTLADHGGPLALLLLLLTVGLPGLWILRFFIREGVDQAMLGAAALPPAPLLRAFAAYLIHPWRRPLAQGPRVNARQQHSWFAPMPADVPARSFAGSTRSDSSVQPVVPTVSPASGT